MDSVNITPIVEAVIALATAVITCFLIPWLKEKCGSEKFEQLRKWIMVAVEAAEQMFTGEGAGEKKKDYIQKFLESKGFKVDEESLDAMIEAAVQEMHHASSEVIVVGTPVEVAKAAENKKQK